jgi:hypothetical protein
VPFAETAALAVATKVLQEATARGATVAGGKLNDRRHREAFSTIVRGAYARFERQHQNWASALVDSSFLEVEAAPFLARLLVPGATLSPTELAEAWADSLAVRAPDKRRARVRELEAPMAQFLDEVRAGLLESPDFRDVVNDDLVHELRRNVQSLVAAANADRATPGTRSDYLRWVESRYSHIDPRGISQTERQVQVPLDRVYVGLSTDDERVLTGAESDARSIRRSDQASGIGLEVALREQCLVLLGDPGSGKTTVLRYLALMHAQAMATGRAEVHNGLGSPRLPILIRVADYAEQGLEDPLSTFLREWHELAEAPTAGLGDLFETSLAAGQALVLFDGLDEIVNAEARQKVVRRIDDFVQRFQPEGNRFVVTSRIAGYRELPLGGSFETFRVRPLDDALVAEFLQRWCRAVEDASSDLPVEQREQNAEREIAGIQAAIAAAPGVKRLATNPLLLTILTLIHRTGAALPQRRIALYDLAVGTLARTWRRAQGVPEAALVDETLLTRVLSTVAYWLHVTRPSGVAMLEDLEPVVEARWAEVQGVEWDRDERPIHVVQQVEQFMTAVRVQTGLLVERAPDRYGFMHLTFEEYYVARELVARHREAVKRLRTHLHDPRWEEPILLALGFRGLSSADDAATLVDAAVLARGDEAEGVAPSVDEDLLGRDFLFGLRCLGDLVPVTPQTRDALLRQASRDTIYAEGRGATQAYKLALFEAVARLPQQDRFALLSLAREEWDAGNKSVWNVPYFEVDFSAAPAEWLESLLAEWDQDPQHANLFLVQMAAKDGNEVALDWLRTHAVQSEGQLSITAAAMLAASSSTPTDTDAAISRLKAALATTPKEVLRLLPFAPRVSTALAEAVLQASRELSDELDTDSVEAWAIRQVFEYGARDETARALLFGAADGSDRRVAGMAVEALLEATPDTGDQRRRIVASILRQLGRCDPEDKVRWLDRLDDALLGIGLTPEVIEGVEPLVDHSDSRVRVAALGVLLWDDVTPALLTRVFESPLTVEAATSFAGLTAVDYEAFMQAVGEYVREARTTASPVAVKELGGDVSSRPWAVDVLRAQAAMEGEGRSAAIVALANGGSAAEREWVASHLDLLSADDQLRVVLDMQPLHDDVGAIAVLDAAGRIDDVAPVARLARVGDDGPGPDEEDLRWGFACTDERVRILAVGVAGERGPWPLEIVEAIVDLLPMHRYRNIETARAVSDALVRLSVWDGGTDGATYQLVRRRYLQAPADLEAAESSRSGLYEILIRAAAPPPARTR